MSSIESPAREGKVFVRCLWHRRISTGFVVLLRNLRDRKVVKEQAKLPTKDLLPVWKDILLQMIESFGCREIDVEGSSFISLVLISIMILMSGTAFKGINGCRRIWCSLGLLVVGLDYVPYFCTL